MGIVGSVDAARLALRLGEAPTLEFDASAYTIRDGRPDPQTVLHVHGRPNTTDESFVLNDCSVFGIADTGAIDAACDAAQSTSLTSRYENTSAILDSAVLTSLTEPAAMQDLRSVLAESLSRVSRPLSASALLVSLDHGVLRSAYVGTCAYVVLRGETIIHRSPRAGSVAALERAFSAGARAGASSSGSGVVGSSGGRDWDRRLPPIGSAALEVQDGDVVIAGSDGFFANVSERQMLALLRPTENDAHDSSLSIANNTCLATWTSDDPVFLAYMLAHLAWSFASDPADTSSMGSLGGEAGGAYMSASTDIDGDVTVIVAVVGTVV
ncbi:hypothetical protein MMPV_000699 [Pyropia vietnamensis]